MRLSIAGSGMVTPVGYQAPSSCAAIRCGIDGFRRTAFKLGGEWVKGAVVEAPDALAGVEKLAWMATRAIDECMTAAPPGHAEDTAVALCVAEETRPGRSALPDDRFFINVIARIRAAPRLGPHRQLFKSGSLGGVQALEWAQQLLAKGAASHCVVAGVDSYLHGPTIAAYHAARRLVTADNGDGFLPGEASAAVLLSRSGLSSMECLGTGWGREHATQDSGLPLRGDGLANAYRAAFKAAECGFPAVDYRMADIAGDQYAFKEAALAVLRTMRVRKESFYLWHPADCVGRVGAASVPLMLGLALAASRKAYAPGPGVLCHFTDDDGVRAAVVLRDGRAPAPMVTVQGVRTHARQ